VSAGVREYETINELVSARETNSHAHSTHPLGWSAWVHETRVHEHKESSMTDPYNDPRWRAAADRHHETLKDMLDKRDAYEAAHKEHERSCRALIEVARLVGAPSP